MKLWRRVLTTVAAATLWLPLLPVTATAQTTQTCRTTDGSVEVCRSDAWFHPAEGERLGNMADLDPSVDHPSWNDQSPSGSFASGDGGGYVASYPVTDLESNGLNTGARFSGTASGHLDAITVDLHFLPVRTRKGTLSEDAAPFPAGEKTQLGLSLTIDGQILAEQEVVDVTAALSQTDVGVARFSFTGLLAAGVTGDGTHDITLTVHPRDPVDSFTPDQMLFLYGTTEVPSTIVFNADPAGFEDTHTVVDLDPQTAEPQAEVEITAPTSNAYAAAEPGEPFSVEFTTDRSGTATASYRATDSGDGWTAFPDALGPVENTAEVDLTAPEVDGTYDLRIELDPDDGTLPGEDVNLASLIVETPPSTEHITVLDETFPVAEGVGDFTGMALWSEGRRAFQVATVDRVAHQVVALDLDTFEEVGRSVPLEHTLFESPGADHIAVDGNGGRLFIAYQHDVLTGSCGSGMTLQPCLGGILVLDAGTLEVVDDIPFALISSEGQIAFPNLDRIAYSPALGDDDGKLHLLVHDDVTGGAYLLGWRSRQNRTYAIQVDPDTGTSDWRYRVGGCAGLPYEEKTADRLQNGFALFRTRDPDRPFLYAGCYAGGGASQVVRMRLDPTQPDAPPSGEERFPGPGGVWRMLADPIGERILIEARVGPDQEWWAFDGRSGYIGAFGIGPYDSFVGYEAATGIDPATGRHYALAPAKPQANPPAPGGLFVTDARRSRPLPQAAHYPDFEKLLTDACDDGGGLGCSQATPVLVDPAAEGRPRRVFIRPGVHIRRTNADAPDHYIVLEDRKPVSVDPETTEEVRSTDVAESEETTTATFDGRARGYGLRTILVGGLDPFLRVIRPAGTDLPRLKHSQLERMGHADECVPRDRESAFGLVGAPDPAAPGHGNPALVNDLGRSAATAQGAYLDPGTREDLANPYSRCSVQEDEEMGTWEGLTAGIVDMQEPGADWQVDIAQCDPQERTGSGGHSELDSIHAEVACTPGQAVSGRSQASVGDLGAVTVASASSQMEIDRGELNEGLRGRIVSTVDGIEIAATPASPRITIGQIEASAEVWATGRHQAAGDGDTNCVDERTAGTCYTRTFRDVTIEATDSFPGFSCVTCPSNEQVATALGSALPGDWQVEMPDPAPALAAGREDGSQAGVQKQASDALRDEILHADAMLVLPALQLVRVADGDTGVGRQVFQFAGVQTGTSYGITCLQTVVDERCTENPGSVTVALTDLAGEALAGGLFELYRDLDGDGVVGLDDPSAGTCTTGADGGCPFGSVPAGDYVVRQSLAPSGYRTADDIGFTVTPGGDVTVDVVNVRDAAGIGITLTDDAADPQPLAGGAFEIHADDGDETLGAGDVALTACRTDASGICRFDTTLLPDGLRIAELDDGTPVLQVPVGSYVIHQSAAPDGYVAADDIGFTFTDPGQLAVVGVRNSPGGSASGQPSTSGDDTSNSSDGVTGGSDGEEYEEFVVFDPPAEAGSSSVSVAAPAPEVLPPVVAGPEPELLERVVKAPVAAIQLLRRSPGEAAAFAGVLLLFAAAVGGAMRRRLFLDLLQR